MKVKSFDGCMLHCETRGSGPAVVFAHESAADLRQWRGQMEALSEAYTCVAYNARGYSPSDIPQDDADYGHVAAWRDLAAVVEAVADGSAHIVGLSMGAYAGLMLALERPNLVRSLVFAGGGTGSSRPPDQTMRGRMEELARVFMEEGTGAAAERITAPPNRTGFRRRDPAGWQAWYDDLCEHSAPGMAMTYRNFQGRRPSLYDFEEGLAKLAQPVLLVVGDEDPSCHDVNLFLKRTLPDAGLLMVPHSGHAVNLEAPELFDHELRAFLDRVEDRAG